MPARDLDLARAYRRSKDHGRCVWI